MLQLDRRSSLWLRRKRHTEELSDPEILSLSISNEEGGAQAYTGFAERLRDEFSETARVFTDMAEEETGHPHQLVALFRSKFGEAIPPIETAGVQGLLAERPGTMLLHGPGALCREARQTEASASRFYHRAASRTLDVTIRNVLGDLAIARAAQQHITDESHDSRPPSRERQEETEAASRHFMLQVVQPGLVGLMDGSEATLAPVLAIGILIGSG